ncbi:MAG: hypothetical protein WEC33_07860 [Dehalococcoidia bacterium]
MHSRLEGGAAESTIFGAAYEHGIEPADHRGIVATTPQLQFEDAAEAFDIGRSHNH